MNFFLSPSENLVSPVPGEILNFTRSVCGFPSASFTYPAYIICVCLKKAKQRPDRKGQLVENLPKTRCHRCHRVCYRAMFLSNKLCPDGNSIAGFHCHTIIKTLQQIRSRIKEVKQDEHSNSLAKIQVCAIFRAGDIRRNVLPKFIRLCMETTCLCPSEGHKYGGRKLTKTYVIEFAIKSL